MNVQRLNTILTLLNLKGIGPAFIGKHEQIISKAIDEKSDIDLILEETGKTNFSETDLDSAKIKADETVDLITQNDIHVIDFLDKGYPKKLREGGLKFPVLFYLGNLNFESKITGIIGSRNATDVSTKIAGRIGQYFSEQGYSILGGLAKGIDAAGIKSNSAGKTAIGVVPAGLNFQNEKLFSKDYREEAERILDLGGGLVSSFLPNEKQDQYKVVKYCKLQALLSDTLVLVQSGLDGGSRFTVEEFCKLNRPLGVVNALSYDSANKDKYSANELLISQKVKGVSEWCEVKENKIACSVHALSTKEDYLKLMNDSAEERQSKLF